MAYFFDETLYQENNSSRIECPCRDVFERIGVISILFGDCLGHENNLKYCYGNKIISMVIEIKGIFK